MSSKSIGRKLEEIRKRLGKTRKQVIHDLTAGSKPVLHEMHEITLYKYEKGILEASEEFLKQFAKKYSKHGVKLAEIKKLRRLDRPLQVALGPYPDFAFFCAIAKP